MVLTIQAVSFKKCGGIYAEHIPAPLSAHSQFIDLIF